MIAPRPNVEKRRNERQGNACQGSPVCTPHTHTLCTHTRAYVKIKEQKKNRRTTQNPLCSTLFLSCDSSQNYQFRNHTNLSKSISLFPSNTFHYSNLFPTFLSFGIFNFVLRIVVVVIDAFIVCNFSVRSCNNKCQICSCLSCRLVHCVVSSMCVYWLRIMCLYLRARVCVCVLFAEIFCYWHCFSPCVALSFSPHSHAVDGHTKKCCRFEFSLVNYMRTTAADLYLLHKLKCV